MEEITEEALDHFYHLHAQKKEMERELNTMRKSFHLLFDQHVGKNQKGELQRGRYKIQRSIRKATSYDPEPTVKRLEELQLEDLVILEKRPDTDKLAAAFEIGLVDQKEFADCKSERQTQSIVVRLIG